MRYQVLVRLKTGVLDVQGKAIETGLKDKKFESFRNIRVGRVIELEVEGLDKEKAKAQVDEVCKLLLANPVIEQYEIREVA
jgi:phosphoribosylformylglycinamidine synthase PurS subunit